MTNPMLLICVLWLFVVCAVGASPSEGQTATPPATPRGDGSLRMVPLDAERWQLDDGAEIVSFGGRTALAGTAYVKDASFEDGTLEADVWITGEVKFAGFTFRVQSFDEYEWCWLRTHKTNGFVQDGVQYAPALKGVPCWQLYGGPGGFGPANVPKHEWVHLKMEIRGESAALFVSDMTKPVLVMDRLQLGPKRGSVGVRTTVKGGVYFSNFAYRIDERAPLPAKERVIPRNVLAQWQLSPSYPTPSVAVVPTYPAQQLAEVKDWITPKIEDSGLVNITRYHGSKYHARTGPVEGSPDYALLRTFLDAQEERLVRMNFGYSDAATIFLNGVPLFWGNSAFLSRNKADGEWISFNDAVFLNLKKGRNELLVVVAEDFGGWGFQARLDSVDAIEVQSK